MRLHKLKKRWVHGSGIITTPLLNSNSINRGKLVVQYRDDRPLAFQKQQVICKCSTFQDPAALEAHAGCAWKPSAHNCTCQAEAGDALVYTKAVSWLYWSFPTLTAVEGVIKACVGLCIKVTWIVVRTVLWIEFHFPTVISAHFSSSI